MANSVVEKACKDLQEKFEETVKILRVQLQDCDEVSYFDMQLNACGRVHTDDIKVTYSVSDSSYSSSNDSHNLSRSYDEFVRRYQWKKRNEPKMLKDHTNEEPF